MDSFQVQQDERQLEFDQSNLARAEQAAADPGSATYFGSPNAIPEAENDVQNDEQRLYQAEADAC